MCRAWTHGDGEGKEWTGTPPDAARRWPAVAILLLRPRRRLKWQQSWKMLSVTTTAG